MAAMAVMVPTPERDLLMLTATTDTLEDTDMAAMAVMVTTSERDLLMLTATTDTLEDTVMAVMVTISERDLLMLTATTDTLEDTDTVVTEVTDITLERDLLKPKASHTTATEVCMVDMVMVDTVDTLSENRFDLPFIYLVI